MARRRLRAHRGHATELPTPVAAVELDVAHVDVLRSAHVNRVNFVFTIGRVAKDLGEDEDWLWDVANGVDPVGGVISVYSIGNDGSWRSPTRLT